MFRTSLLLVLIATALADTTFGETPRPEPVLPDSFTWYSPPGNPSLRAAWILGGEQLADPYLLRVELGAGARIAPHTHPDTRNTTVLSGTLYVGFGEAWDEAQMVTVPVGAVYVAPADVPHFLWARDGDVVYQESGVGPSASVWLEPPPAQAAAE